MAYPFIVVVSVDPAAPVAPAVLLPVVPAVFSGQFATVVFPAAPVLLLELLFSHAPNATTPASTIPATPDLLPLLMTASPPSVRTRTKVRSCFVVSRGAGRNRGSGGATVTPLVTDARPARKSTSTC
jgi:hypothetical protein